MESGNEPAGGAAVDQVIVATAGAGVVTLLLLWLVLGHRSGRVPVLDLLGAFSARVSGLPPWAALPAGLATGSLLTALVGMYWDISLHIDDGRDAGPLVNPAHYLILAGLYGVFAAGLLAMAMPRRDERPGPAAVRLAPGCHVPVGGLLMTACGAFALVGFPLDDVWHRLFGQDVTLWGPTHLMLIGGAGMTLVGQAVLLAEGMWARRRARAARADSRPRRAPSKLQARITASRRMAILGGLLIGLSTFQAEFDFGVPQYPLVLQPFLIALAAGVALVGGRLWVGPGGALGAAVFFLVVRGAVSLIVGPVLGETTPSLPLYLGEALCVELAALALARRPLALGAVGGALVGTVGLASEWAWSHVAMPLPWTADILPEAVVLAVAGGVAGGLVGALLAQGLRGRLPRRATARRTVAGAGLAVAACVAAGLATTTPEGAKATVTLTGDTGGPAREAHATFRVSPASLAEDPAWATVTSWQGGDLHVDRLEHAGPGVLRTTEPMPLHGEWKTMLRLHGGRALVTVPIYLPADRAIPAAAVPATARFERPFVLDRDVLQRERKDDVPGWLWAVASAAVLALYLAFLAALAWGVGRLGRAIAAGSNRAEDGASGFVGRKPEPAARRVRAPAGEARP